AAELAPYPFDLALESAAILVGDAVGIAIEQRRDSGDRPAVAFEHLHHVPERARSRAVFDALADHAHGVEGDCGLVCGAGAGGLSAAAAVGFGGGEFPLEAFGIPQRLGIEAERAGWGDNAAALELLLVGIVHGSGDAVRLGNHASVLVGIGGCAQ